MTAYDVAAFLMAPVGLLLLGAGIYWIATRPEKPHDPAE